MTPQFTLYKHHCLVGFFPAAAQRLTQPFHKHHWRRADANQTHVGIASPSMTHS